jgi:hypothetical protein
MLLSEAAKTGRKFRRKSEQTIWYRLSGKSVYRCPIGDPAGETCEQGWENATIDAEMIVANDWEAAPKIIQITSNDLMDVAKTLSNNPICNQRRLPPVEFMKLVITELGLEE